MHKEGDEVHIDTDEARGGQSTGPVRWVLIIGTVIAIILLSITWIGGALSSPDDEAVGDISGQVDPAE